MTPKHGSDFNCSGSQKIHNEATKNNNKEKSTMATAARHDHHEGKKHTKKREKTQQESLTHRFYSIEENRMISNIPTRGSDSIASMELSCCFRFMEIIVMHEYI